MSVATSSSRSLAQWLDYLESIHPTTIELGLERVGKVADTLQLRQLAPSKVVLVAGTNGKGSTCRYLEMCLLEAGYSVGVYCSPHVLDYKERVRLNDVLLSEREHCLAFEAVETARADVSLSYFEFGTLAALELLRQRQPDVILLEVGLGGRLDATNIVEPDVSVVTSVDFDHQVFLGSELEKIGFEKAGVFRSGKPAIIGSGSLPTSVFKQALDINAHPWVNGADFSIDSQNNYQGKKSRWHDLPTPQLPLANLPTALATLEALELHLTETQVQSAIAKANLPGRWQVLQEAPLVVLDVAHNPQATTLLMNNIQTQQSKRVLGVVAMLSDKDSASSLQPLLDVIDEWYVAGLDVPRGADSDQLRQSLPLNLSVTCFEKVSQAMAAALESAEQGDMVIVFGSFYTVAEATVYWQGMSEC